MISIDSQQIYCLISVTSDILRSCHCQRMEGAREYLYWQNYSLLSMNKDDIIKNLCKQNEQLKKEANYWKNEYHRLAATYQQLLASQRHHKVELPPKQPISKSVQHQDTYIFDFDTPIVTTSPSPDKVVSPKIQPNQSRKVHQTPKATQVVVKAEQGESIFDFFSKEVHNAPQLDKSICELIEGCFIIEKNSSIDHFDPVRFNYPSNKYTKLRSMFDIIYRYVFVNDSLVEIHDDEFDSRKNQIVFGTPCEDFQFIFDNLSEKEGEKGRLNQFQRSTYLMRKRYVYGIVMPQIVEMGSQCFQTQLAYGFISHLPFPSFFRDLNRIVQQEIKLQMLKMNKNKVQKSQKVDLIADIIKHITAKSLQKQLIVTDYPVNLELKANICGLRLIYSTKNNYISDQFNTVEHLIHKYSFLKIVKILHYVLAEHSMIIVCKSRKALNQIFELIRVIIYPFNWIFPIIYFYTPFFEPFLSSPLPILIGHLDRRQEEEEEDRNSYKRLALPEHQFITIYAEDEDAQDENEPEGFSKRIKKWHKKMVKERKSTVKSQKDLSSLMDRPVEERITNQLFQYVKKLRGFIQSGKTQQEVDQFLIEFMQTQMVSYYKENRKDMASSHR